MRTTHTFATLPVSASTYQEISDLLRNAGYNHVFVEDAIDMSGIALVQEQGCQCSRERVLRNVSAK